MDSAFHRFSELFDQLGLPDDPASIRGFLARHAPLGAAIALPEAPFWTPAQAAFLRDALQQDSDWALPADQLSQALRGRTGWV